VIQKAVDDEQQEAQDRGRLNKLYEKQVDELVRNNNVLSAWNIHHQKNYQQLLDRVRELEERLKERRTAGRDYLKDDWESVTTVKAETPQSCCNTKPSDEGQSCSAPETIKDGKQGLQRRGAIRLSV
jgi:hypothetical protein